ncbi:hypothetical protein SEA_CARTHAGE_94 [Mycobacterium phage Carthage]|nr:hypothetical protein SEA_CARTHAGE_94 [Mycobacterium phage Carthage]
MPTSPACDCLTSEDHTLPHATMCAAAFNGHDTDHSQIRELAELAAYKDIDTALSILRAYRNGSLS